MGVRQTPEFAVRVFLGGSIVLHNLNLHHSFRSRKFPAIKFIVHLISPIYLCECERSLWPVVHDTCSSWLHHCAIDAMYVYARMIWVTLLSCHYCGLSVCTVVGVIRHYHIPGYCVDWQVHNDMHRDSFLCLDRQRSEFSLPPVVAHNYSRNDTAWHSGELLTSVQTHQAPNTCAVVSPCGKFIGCAGT